MAVDPKFHAVWDGHLLNGVWELGEGDDPQDALDLDQFLAFPPSWFVFVAWGTSWKDHKEVPCSEIRVGLPRVFRVEFK